MIVDIRIINRYKKTTYLWLCTAANVNDFEEILNYDLNIINQW